MHDKPTPLLARAPVTALADVSEFLSQVEQLKSLTLALAERRLRESRFCRTLEAQIATITKTCEACAEKSPRVQALWREARAELETFAL